jgi:phosphoglycolate phosphatase
MAFRAILFDLDGTLLDTLADIAHAANEALAFEGFPTHAESDYLRFIGDGVAMLMRRALPPDIVDDTLVGRGVACFQETYAKQWNVQTKPYAGIVELLDALTARGLPLAVLSNKPDDFTQLFGQTYLAPWPFRAIIGHRGGVPCKPDPASALEIADRLGVEPASCLFVGDSAVDMQTARNAGMSPVGVSWGFQPVETLREAGAWAIIDHPSGLLDLLDGGGDRGVPRIE